MKSYLGPLILVITILIRVEFFALNGVSEYDSYLPHIADTEWIHEEKITRVYKQLFIDELIESASYLSLNKSINPSKVYFYLQFLYYPEKLQLSDGYIFVSISTPRSNIPHDNSDEEDPAFHIG